jgi:putative ABC transport system permease protein
MTLPDYFKGFGRQLAKHKGYFIIHILGITLGLTAAGFALIYVHHELSYDTMHPEAPRIYRVSYQNKSGWFASLARPYADALRMGSIPQIESVVRLRRWPAKMVYVGGKRLHSPKLLFTDPATDYFRFFYTPFVQGDATSALRAPNSAVISETLSRTYFGSSMAVGQMLRLDTMELTVTGVMKDLPSRTHLVFDMLISNSEAMDAASAHYTYAMLASSASPDETAARILSLPVEVSTFQVPLAMRLINVRDLHYEGNMTYEFKPAGSKTYLWILVTIGVIIIVIAGTNYVNLSVALYAYRSKEIAVRKSIGASATGLSRQFFIESCAIILVAVMLSGLLIVTLTPKFNELMGLRVTFPFSSPWFVVCMLAIALIIATCAAIYPITVLPGVRILDLFKSSGITTHHGLRLRKILLTVQFVILFFVCCSLWFINSQFNYVLNKDLGFTKEGVIKLKGAWNVDSTHYWRLKAELSKDPSVLFVSEGYAPGDEDYGYTFRVGDNPSIQENLLVHNSDYDYLCVLGIRVIDSLHVTGTAGTPRRRYFVNEAMAKLFGPGSIIGKSFVLNPGQKSERSIAVDGVVSDYNFQSLHSPVGPQVLSLSERSKYVDGTVLVKVATTNLQSTIEFVHATLAKVVPEEPLTIDFLEDDLEGLYHQEAHMNRAVVVLAVISLILSFTGLLALCSYMVEFRLKEVAVRKVFGAGTSHIIALFARNFLGITIISFLAGATASIFFMDKWMESFAYRIAVGATPFFIILFGTIALVLSLVCIQSMRAARLNPSAVLKNE